MMDGWMSVATPVAWRRTMEAHPISRCGRFARVEMQDLWPCPGVAVRSYGLDVSSYGLTVLDREECEALLRTQRVGRVGVCQVAAMVDAPRALVLVSVSDWERLQQGRKASGAWAFFLEPAGEFETRFLVRSSGGPVGTHLFDAVHFVMEQKMMRGLRDRAEAATA
jgi:hypothetical protein